MKDEIKKALEQATQGKWESTVTGVERDTGEPLSRGYVRIANLWGIQHSNNPNHENDAHLIANAPEWLRWQNERIEQLEKALDRIHTESTDAWAIGYALRVLQNTKSILALGKDD